LKICAPFVIAIVIIIVIIISVLFRRQQVPVSLLHSLQFGYNKRAFVETGLMKLHGGVHPVVTWDGM
jgi:hypothetical protein